MAGFRQASTDDAEVARELSCWSRACCICERLLRGPGGHGSAARLDREKFICHNVHVSQVCGVEVATDLELEVSKARRYPSCQAVLHGGSVFGQDEHGTSTTSAPEAFTIAAVYLWTCGFV